MSARAAVRASHHRKPDWLRRVAVVSVVGLVLTACGGDEPEEAAEEPTEETGEEPTEEPGEEETGEEETEAPAEDWPTDDIRFLVGASEGGGLDTAARLMNGPISERLGVNVVVENLPGAQTSIAAQTAFREGDECDVMVFNNFPIFQFSYRVNDVDYTLDDVYPVAAVQRQPSVFVVPGDSEIDTMDDLIAAIEADPGGVTASVSSIAGTNALGIMELEDEFGLDVNIIDYDGGSPARQAVLSGEVDFSHTSVFAALPLIEGGELKMLAAHQSEEDWEEFQQHELLADVPTVNEALGVDLGSNTATYGITVNKTCFEEHPERHQTLVDAVDDVLADPEFNAQLEELGLALSTIDLSPDEYYEQLQEQDAAVEAAAEEMF